jgi:hypothetical protein
VAQTTLIASPPWISLCDSEPRVDEGLRAYNRLVIVLNEKEEQLVRTIRTLPEAITSQVMVWTTRMAELAAGRPIAWSDSWTDEDMQDVTGASLRRFEESNSSAS